MKESLKLKLLRVAANNASCTAEVKSLLDFITKDEKPAESKRVEVKTSLEDGVYVVFSSGEIKPVSEYNEQCEPAKVLMIYRDHSWIVAPRDAECGELDDDAFIPTAGQLAAMWLYRDVLNKALKDTGGEPLNTYECYWSSSEVNANYSWGVNFGDGDVYINNYKSGDYCVRPCTAFNL